MKIGQAPRIAAEEQNDWNLEQAVRETEKKIFHRPTDGNDGNHKRSKPAENSSMPGKTTARNDTRRIPKHTEGNFQAASALSSCTTKV